MALVSTPITHTFRLLDGGGRTFTLRFKTTGDNFTNSYSLLQNAITLLAALTKLTLIGAGFTYQEVEENVVAGAGEGEEKAEINVRLITETPTYAPGQTTTGTIYIPGPVPGIFAGAEGTDLYDIVDPADADLLAFLALFEAGLGILPSYSLSDYQTIADPTTAGNVKGKRIHKGSRRG
jgi:hypothetical protein